MGSYKVDIILPAYNGAEYLKELMDSLFSQTYYGFKVLVRDDGSKDGTLEILIKYKNLYPDKIQIIKDSLGNLGVIRNVFEILKYSKGQYIMLCDQDDVWLSNKVESLLRCIRKKEKENISMPVFVHSDAAVVNRHLEVMDPSFSHYSGLDRKHDHLCNLLQKNVVQGASSVFNRLLLDKLWKVADDSYKKKGINEIVYHDLWLAVAASLFGKIYYYPYPLMYYRQHGKNLVGAEEYKETIKNFFTRQNWDKVRNKNYLAVNRHLCNVILKNYKENLSEEQKKVLMHYRDRSSDMKEFFRLGLYHFYSPKEILMMIIFGVY